MADNTSNYKAFAGFLSRHPDVLCLKRFPELQIRNLLFYQAELAHHKLELQEIEDRDTRDSPDPSNRVNYRWNPLMAAENTLQTASSTMTSEYCKKMLVIRETLASYSKSLSLQQPAAVSDH